MLFSDWVITHIALLRHQHDAVKTCRDAFVSVAANGFEYVIFISDDTKRLIEKPAVFCFCA